MHNTIKYITPLGNYDVPTGYYGARYYEPVLTLWYGVDAMTEKYPSVSPYNYCLENPINLIDPDGNDGNVTIDYENRTVNVNQVFYYNINKSSIKNYDLDIENLFENAVKSDNGFWIQSWKIEDTNSQEWTITFSLQLVGCDSENEINDKLLANPAGNKIQLLTNNELRAINPNRKKTVDGFWVLANKTITITETGDVETLIHEIGHSLGLPHENLMQNSPIYNSSDNGISSREIQHGIMSYSLWNRKVQYHEVKYFFNNVLGGIINSGCNKSSFYGYTSKNKK